jgi:hypothetical protein
MSAALIAFFLNLVSRQMTRTTSIWTTPRAWRVGRALTQPQRFTDLLALFNHTDALARVLRKSVADGLAMKRNDGLYALTSDGAAWIECATPLLRWLDQHPRNKPAPQRRKTRRGSTWRFNVKVYLHGDREIKQQLFKYSINPGLSGLIAEDDLPREWKIGDEPREFKIEFSFGCAEVDDMLGRWLIKHQMVHDRPGKAPPKIVGALARLIRGR